MQRVAVIGLGRFGMNLARQLAANRVEVIAIDRNGRLVDEVKDHVALAVCLDSTTEAALKSQDVPSCDVCVVAIGENFEASLLTATALKKLGCKYVIVRAQSANHAEIFRRLGADEVIQPETEAGRQLARRLANPMLEDVIELGDGFTLIEVRAPASFHGKSLEQLALRARPRKCCLVIFDELRVGRSCGGALAPGSSGARLRSLPACSSRRYAQHSLAQHGDIARRCGEDPVRAVPSRRMR